MKGVYAILRRFSRGLYVFSSMVLLVLLALLFRDAGGVMWRSICLALFIGAVLYEAMWRSDRQSCPEVTGLMWFPAVLLCIPLFLGGLVRGFVMWQWPVAEVHMAITGLPYALLAGGGLSVLFLAGMTVEAILRRN
ncbi:hypothetical protein [Salmonella enterica]|uniref:Uncharacterized protein n=3 Tax=Salmonella enterica TaxID=28901 RepID=A0A379QHC3_SALER|nr:hypothetical protein [Salmonella enterica]ECC1658020.1 hypothetical protein [Salmonella enterica subsp. salamae]ECF3884949.1 hypothetical protein [Salmonella enterica subsp. enterica serovar Ank]EDJ9085728.1 hypothetical protein [Salmonella enterica subsp. enterica serovar Vitkin]EGI5053801.1 hypothetical protein [Salmonella enterica subsp. enterica serovar Worthington]ASG86802.1 hypothetical protein LFZ47_03960 [Salmonella enterica subsp. salamae serovar 55:k:z39 str. 1315K]